MDGHTDLVWNYNLIFEVYVLLWNNGFQMVKIYISSIAITIDIQRS